LLNSCSVSEELVGVVAFESRQSENKEKWVKNIFCNIHEMMQEIFFFCN